MNNYFILIKGEKGLYTSDGKRILFPDRRFDTATEGVVKNVRITVDKERYAFFTGEMMNLEDLSDEEELRSFITTYTSGVHNMNPNFKDTFFKKVKIYDNKIAVVFCQNQYSENLYWDNVFVIVKEKGVYWVVDEYHEYTRNNILNHIIYDFNKVHSIDIINLDVNSIQELTEKNKLRIIFDNFHGDDFKVINNKIIISSYKYSKTVDLFWVDENDNIRNISVLSYKIDDVLTSKETYDISSDEVIDLAIKHGVRLNTYSWDSDADIITRTIKVMGQEIELSLFNSKRYKFVYDLDENHPYRIKVKESLENLESFRKHIAKNINSKNLPELSKLSLKNIVQGK